MNPMVLFVTVFSFTAVVFGFGLSLRFKMRELDHKERLAALEKGVDLPARQTAPWTPRTYLLHGMIWLFAGLAAMIAMFAIAAASARPYSAEEKVHAVSDARARGATPEEVQIVLNDRGARQGIPMAVGLLGLIPVGVGMAYLIFYRVESRKLVS